MNRLLTILIVLAICAVGIGFYRGWFTLSSPSPAVESNEVNVNLATHTDKMKEDVETVKDKAAELTGNDAEHPSEPADAPTSKVQQNQMPADDK